MPARHKQAAQLVFGRHCEFSPNSLALTCLEQCRFPARSFDVLMKDTPKGETDVMRYLSIYKSVETNEPPTPEMMAKMGALIEKSMKAGTLVATEGCLPSTLGARVRKDGNKITVTDGPFTEAKEVVGGFALLEARSKEHAIELAQEFLAVAGGGECELRQIYTGQPGEAACVGHEVNAKN